MRAWAIPLVVAALGYVGADPPATAPAKPAVEKIDIAGEVFKLELAIDEAAREKGLMGREKIDDDGGMLFVYPKPGVLTFWMANCKVDIDVVFLDAEGTIVTIRKMKVEPAQRSDESKSDYQNRLKLYSSRRPAQFAIELKPGTPERLKLKAGQKIAMDVARLKKLAK
ncbi:MAG: DUF192 domain-containing protein [Phycisphaerales bacterium]|nr:DUF192 domain-containing protein [Phycisphaerales bacterium]